MESNQVFISKKEQVVSYVPYQTLIEKIEELDIYSHQIMQQWPKIEKFVLVSTIRENIMSLRRLCVIAWKKRIKTDALFDLDVEIDILRHQVRKAYLLKYINARRFEIWTTHINEIGRMVGSWIKHSAN